MEYDKFKRGEITKDEYDDWRYNYPKIEVARTKAALDARRMKKKEDKSWGFHGVQCAKY